MTSTAYQRIIRRETHSPRTAAMIVAVVLAIVVLAYVGTETVLSLLSQPALLISPEDAGMWLAELSDQQPAAAIIAIAVLVAVVGIVFIVLAVTPGRLPKQQLAAKGRVVLADNAVIAAALAQHLSDETGIARDRITIGVSASVVDIAVTPDAGIPVPDERLLNLVATELDSYRLTRPLKTRMRSMKRRTATLS